MQSTIGTQCVDDLAHLEMIKCRVFYFCSAVLLLSGFRSTHMCVSNYVYVCALCVLYNLSLT